MKEQANQTQTRTVAIPDDLHRQLKRLALEGRTTLSAIVEKALRDSIGRQEASSASA